MEAKLRHQKCRDQNGSQLLADLGSIMAKRPQTSVSIVAALSTRDYLKDIAGRDAPRSAHCAR